MNLLHVDRTINDVRLRLQDCEGSRALNTILNELQKDSYKLEPLFFQPGSVILDIGAHVGTVAIYLAKKYPRSKIYCYEPLLENYANLLDNLANNGVVNVEPFQEAVSADGRPITLYPMWNNTGGSRSCPNTHCDVNDKRIVLSRTLDDIFQRHAVESCAFLKFDTEGAEYTALPVTTVLPKVQHLGIEFHRTHDLDYVAETRKLLAWLQRQNSAMTIAFSTTWKGDGP